MYFISRKLASVDRTAEKLELHPIESDLPGEFFNRKRRRYRQQSESVKLPDIRLCMVRIEYLLAEHLIAAANSDQRRAFIQSPTNFLIETFRAEFKQIIGSIFTARQNDQIGIVEIARRRRVIQLHVRLAVETVEIREV